MDWSTVHEIMPTVIAPPLFPPSVSRSNMEQDQKFSGPNDILAASLTTGVFFDVMFLAYTRRGSSKNSLLRPEPIYATSRVLEDVGVDVTSDECSMWKRVSPSGAPSRSELYDYEEDSDVDEDEQQVLEELVPEPVDADTLTDHDSDCVTVEHSPTDSSCTTSDLASIQKALHQMYTQHLPTYVITGVSHRTWRAFIYYCYTKQVNFASLTSMQTQIDTHASTQAPLCSPKSMYRLAMKLNIPTLAEKALRDLKTKLTVDNVLPESLSKFAATYPEVREITTSLLLKHRCTPEIIQSLPAQVERMLSGEMPHVKPVLLALLGAQAPSPVISTLHQVISSTAPKPFQSSFSLFGGRNTESFRTIHPTVSEKTVIASMGENGEDKFDSTSAYEPKVADVAAAGNVAAEFTPTDDVAKPLFDPDSTVEPTPTLSHTDTKNDSLIDIVPICSAPAEVKKKKEKKSTKEKSPRQEEEKRRKKNKEKKRVEEDIRRMMSSIDENHE
ncbi:hypothetical protein CONPUDRAFT_81282 [Coniophora puteana RWD-64-598 SS2]|uniref:Uncharacterized protein n=1 Tax=Coniophora puteana (strain RWD-64-598) TaxID=741705 RepID=A0A5M3MVW7_CONPW|nr:uncharacterized protein CONPUDRAFT_81282 [Coniophora puteana RWD-64-598 SS2]EIW83283.1 hypothetical protein CONPUDRAFT_81282 [Coniophora puteana RWD-64-598 SS2]